MEEKYKYQKRKKHIPIAGSDIIFKKPCASVAFIMLGKSFDSLMIQNSLKV